MKAIIYNKSICEETFEIHLVNISTFGGEFWDGDFEIKDYGIQLGELTIDELAPEQFKELAVQMINHLLTNGHDFSFYDCNQGNGKRFKAE